jgi:gas vesicle protein GvpO
MAESTKKASQERRRSLVEEPFEQLDAEAKGQGETLRKAALAAAVTAGAGALAGAAKALLDKRKAHESPPTSDAESGSDEPDDAQPEPEARAPEATAAEELDDEDAEETDDETDDELDERHETDDNDLEDAAQAGTNASEIVSYAREELERLLGREPEAVSGIERRNGHWSVTLEVVELRRIPDSTDVLGSYELVLDDDGNVARMARRARYLRSQAEGRR